MFNKLYKKSAITKNHFERVLKNKSYVLARGSNTEPKNISTSMDFSATSLEIVQSKIKYFALQDTIELIIGDFTKKLQKKLSNKTFSLVLIDSDLYESYAKILPVVWNKLTPGGYIYLDEYYSLKFPGPRIAVDSFVKNQKSILVRLPDWMDFERWALHKPLNV
jgi:predicted O-methyltransferase YrrM